MITTLDYEENHLVAEALRRGYFSFKGDKIYYHLRVTKGYMLSDPEELVRAKVIAHLILVKAYAPSCMKTEVKVPRRTPNDWADVVIYEDKECKIPFLVVEAKREGIAAREKDQGIEQLFGNANSLRSKWGLFDSGDGSVLFDVLNYPPKEREQNRKGTRDSVPERFGRAPRYGLIAGDANADIKPVGAKVLEAKVRRAHSLIWAGGKRDPLTAFREWSKLILTKIEDEKSAKTGESRQFQVGTNEDDVEIANRVHALFGEACAKNPDIFSGDEEINLPDDKITQVVSVLQDVSFMETDLDAIGRAFEFFFGSVFRGELGQYFTMRPLARFAVAMLNPTRNQKVIDITCGSGGFLLEAILQVWQKIDRDYAGRPLLVAQNKFEYSQNCVFGVEIHPTLAQICRINLLIHHDGNSNIEGDRSCLDSTFSNPVLARGEQFDLVVGNPPFGDKVKKGDKDQLGSNSFDNFEVARGCSEIASEHIIIERAVQMLVPGGRFALVVPDGVLNNQADSCVKLRRYLASVGVVEAVVSLPDFAFRTSGAQNTTSILFFRKFTQAEADSFMAAYQELGGAKEEILLDTGASALAGAIPSLGHRVFFAEVDNIGYTTTGKLGSRNDLYCESDGLSIDEQDQAGTILGEYRAFLEGDASYVPEMQNCVVLAYEDVWRSHGSSRMDAKYHIFKAQEGMRSLAPGWVKKPLGQLMVRREERIHPEERPDEYVTVISLGQDGKMRPREAGKGNNPPEWLGMYFENSSSSWYMVHAHDIVYSSIDLWKGCIGVACESFDGAIVTKEYPVYRLVDEEIDLEFLAALLRSDYYQRAFRAITTGHSNRRRTQQADFESVEIAYPVSKQEQKRLVAQLVSSKESLAKASASVRDAEEDFNEMINAGIKKGDA